MLPVFSRARRPWDTGQRPAPLLSQHALMRYVFRMAAFCLVLVWVGCKTASPYDQLEMERKKKEQIEQEKENKGWWNRA